jgi:hypothetical protein
MKLKKKSSPHKTTGPIATKLMWNDPWNEKREITPKWVMGFTSKLQGG